MMKTTYKKNILDLSYARYLQNKTTAIIILVSYVITIVISAMTRQLTFNTNESLALTAIVSAVVTVPCSVYIVYAQKRLKRIPQLIKALDEAHANI